MGLREIITGRRKLAGPAPDRLFAITTANVTFETLGLTPDGTAAVVFQALDTADFGATVRDMEQLVRATAEDSGTVVETSDDSFGFRWLVLRGGALDDLVVGIHAVGAAIESGGYGDRLLCAVFAFVDAHGHPTYWIYNFKRGAFYPFVPASGEQQRDTERELVLKAQIGAELPIEAELERWFPLWGTPI